MSEELELVTDFASLRAGDLVVVRDCANCHRSHRGLLITPGFGHTYRGEWAPSASWYYVPAGHPRGPGFGPEAVHERRVYRVVIPPATEAREVARPKKLERVK